MRYRLKFIVGIFILLQPYCSLAQDSLVINENWDSLELKCLRSPADTNTVNDLNRLFEYYSSNGKKPAMPFLDRAWVLADSLSYPDGLALTSLNLAMAHDMQGHYYLAFKNYQRALE